MRFGRELGRLDLYLAAAMGSGSEVEQLLAPYGMDLSHARAIKSQLDRARPDDPRKVPLSWLTSSFGRPARVQQDVWFYGLTLWPAHEFAWYISTAQRVGGGEFILLGNETLPSWIPVSVEAARATFRPGHHTGKQVRQVLGEPDLELSWYPEEGWYYGPMHDGQDLVFVFDYGLLRTISVQQSTIDEHRSRGNRRVDDTGNDPYL
jgi:hypothetical protein